MRARRSAESRIAGDWLPVVGVAAVSQTGIGLEQPWTGSDFGLAATALMLSLPLAIRRSMPLVSCVLVALALGAQVAVGGSLHFGSFFAALVAAYAAGRHATRWPLAVVGGLSLLAGALGAIFGSVLEEPSEVVFPVFYLGATVALGRVVRHLTDQADELRRLNEALAGERDIAARLAVATERVRLARDLHDVVAHTLTVMVVQAEAGEDSLERDPAAARRALQRVQQAGRRGLDDLRGMVRVLRSDGDVAAPELSDIDTLAAVLDAAGLAVTVNRDPDTADVDPRLASELVRIVQEALTNVVKHSAATAAEVRLARDADTLHLQVCDSGPALTPGSGSENEGHGIAGMVERVARFGGTVRAGMRAGGGFEVTVTVPASQVEPR